MGLTAQEAACALWPGEEYGPRLRSNYQNAVASLRAALEAVGAQDAVRKEWNRLAAVPERVAIRTPGEAAATAADPLAHAATAAPAGERPPAPAAGRFSPRPPEPPAAPAAVLDTRCPAADLPDLVRRVVVSYYHKEFEPLLGSIDDQIFFIGSGPGIARSRQDLEATCKRVSTTPKFHMAEETFELAGPTAEEAEQLGLAMVTGLYNLYSEGEMHMLTAARQRLSASLRWTDGGWKVFNLHISNEWDELMGADTFPVQTSRATYRYVQQIIKKNAELLQRQRGDDQEWTPFVVDPRSAMYIKADGKGCEAQLTGSRVKLARSIAQLEEGLAADGFVRAHRSYLVNLDQVSELREREIELVDGSVLPVPADRWHAVRAAFERRRRLSGQA